MKVQYSRLFTLLEKKYPDATIGLFSNQVGFDFTKKKYLAELLAEKVSLKKIFIPEHGFFTELQDQETVPGQNGYFFLREGIETVSLYSESQKGFDMDPSALEGLDVIIIDIQDVGTRYYTYITTIAQLFQQISKQYTTVSLILIDRPNLAGRQVEGTALQERYSSLIGWPGIPHRYGLTLGELCLFLKEQVDGNFSLDILGFEVQGVYKRIEINPSPNIPHPETLKVFTGQCLFEGTNVSEGRGTTRPFEIFGAPFFNTLIPAWVEEWNKNNREAILRPLVFRPVFHKYKDQLCYGFQLHPGKKDFHSLWYSLKLIRALKISANEFQWREGPYESGSEKKAIDILAGDELLTGFLNNSVMDKAVIDHIRHSESAWIDQTREFILYGDQLNRLIPA